MGDLFFSRCRYFLALVFFVITNGDSNAQTLIEPSVELAERAYHLIEPYLNNEDALLYKNDVKFIESFPFASYEAIEIKSQGLFYVNKVRDIIKDCLRQGKRWEPEHRDIIVRYTKPGSVAIDIGAHIGTHTITMSECVGKNGFVYAFEPNKPINRELIYNLNANGCKNVYPIRCAIGKVKGVIDIMSSHPFNEGGSYAINSQGGWNSAVQLPLDIFNLDNVSFMKIDVENMEADVLDGAVHTINRCRPVILIEIQGNAERASQLGEDSKKMKDISINKLKKLKYAVKYFRGCDYLAIPK